jgi:hypothetical protein
MLLNSLMVQYFLILAQNYALKQYIFHLFFSQLKFYVKIFIENQLITKVQYKIVAIFFGKECFISLPLHSQILGNIF